MMRPVGVQEPADRKMFCWSGRRDSNHDPLLPKPKVHAIASDREGSRDAIFPLHINVTLCIMGA
jgi:hypothetical protein